MVRSPEYLAQRRHPHDPLHPGVPDAQTVPAIVQPGLEMHDMSGKKLAILILGSVGGLFLLTGFGLLAIGRSQAQAIDQASAGQILRSVAQLGQAPPGAMVMLEGKIAERNSLLDQDFTVYVRSQYRGEHCVTPTPDNDNFDDPPQCESIWVEEKRETPPLWLDLSEGRVQLANTDYRLQHPPAAWQSTPDLVKDQTLRYEGFKINNPVFTQGTVVTGGNNPTFKADFLFGGDSQAYFDDQRSSNSILFLLGSIFTVVGAAALAIMGVILWVRRR
jgi:hypothetical protein